jgi:hypothetical protein
LLDNPKEPEGGGRHLQQTDKTINVPHYISNPQITGEVLTLKDI